jgi:hypothetical protein
MRQQTAPLRPRDATAVDPVVAVWTQARQEVLAALESVTGLPGADPYDAVAETTRQWLETAARRDRAQQLLTQLRHLDRADAAAAARA